MVGMFEEINCPLACPTFTWEIMGRNWTYPFDFGEVPKILPKPLFDSFDKWLVLLKFLNFSSFS